MSLNDPHWGRNGSKETEEEKKDTQQPSEQEDESRDEPPLREGSQRPKVEPEKRVDSDLEDLWRQFNERINSMMGNADRKGRSNPDIDAGSASSNKDEKDPYFQEPPPRENHNFEPPRDTNSVGGNGGGNGRFNKPKFARKSDSFFPLIGFALLVLAVFWLSTGFYIVPEGQKGVVTTFGRYAETTAAGFRWHMPYPIQDVSLVDVSSVRKAEIGMRGSSQRLKEALMLTDDENIVDVMFNVQYRIKDGPGAQEFLFRTRDPMGAVVQTAESAMREVVGRKKMDSVLFESKQEIAEEVKKLMQEMLDRYHSGIQILSVAIQNAQPPEQVQAAFNDAVKAGQDRERQINEGEAYANDVVPKARGTAERLRQEAEAYKSRIVSQAQGDASRFDQVYKQYEQAPKVTRDRMYVDTMQQIYNNTSKVMVDNKNSSNLLYLPLEKLLEKTTKAAEPVVPAGESYSRPSSAENTTTQTTPPGEYDQSTSRPLSRTFR